MTFQDDDFVLLRGQSGQTRYMIGRYCDREKGFYVLGWIDDAYSLEELQRTGYEIACVIDPEQLEANSKFQS